jgi:hypothetical protein
LSLAITFNWIKNSVGFQNLEKLPLSYVFKSPSKELMCGKVSVEIFTNVIDPFWITFLVLKLLETRTSRLLSELKKLNE